MFSYRVHRFIFLFGVLSLAFGMMIGTVPTSVPQLILAGNWVIEMDFARKWKQLKNNLLFWLLSGFYLVHVAGVFYSSDLNAALHDIRTKMPLMFLPLVFLSSPVLSLRELKWVFWCFIAGSFMNTAWCHIYSFVLHNNEVVRKASRFMSHIRLGLYLNMAIAACLYYGFKDDRKWRRLLLFMLALYFLCSMVVLGLAGGLANLALLLLLGSVLVFYTGGKKTRIAGFTVLLLMLIPAIYSVKKIAHEQLSVKPSPVNKPLEKSEAGNWYSHFDSLGQKENGYYVLINIQPGELKRAWNRDFPEDSFSYAPKHNLQRYEVLVRYMSGKGLLKDSVGYSRLNDLEKAEVRKNHTNHLLSEWSFLRKRIYELVNEYDEFGNGRSVNGHSFTMRLYFWKAALHAIGNNWLFGAGTGDVAAELDKSYDAVKSPLSEEWRIRPHNQFLTVWLALGAGGALIFLFSVFVPPLILRNELHALYWPFFILALVSFLFEDTLETQAGLTFFAFFNSLLLCQAWFRRPQTPADQRENH